MNRTRGRAGEIAAHPGPIIEPAGAERRAQITGSDVGDGDDLGGGLLHEHHVVRADHLVERIRHVHVAAFDGEIATERFEARVGQISVFDSGGAAARKRSRRCATEAVGRAAEFVNQRVIPIAHESAEHPDARAPYVHAGIQMLRRRSGRVAKGGDGVGGVPVTAVIEMHAAGQGDAIESVGRADRGAVAGGHLGDRGRRRDGGFGLRRHIGRVGLLRRRRGVHFGFELLELAPQRFDLRLQLFDLLGTHRLRIGRTRREDRRHARGSC